MSVIRAPLARWAKTVGGLDSSDEEHAQPHSVPPCKPVVVVLADTYLPGWRAGGPVRSLANLVSLERDSFDLRVLTRNTDYGSTTPYQCLPSDRWTHAEWGWTYYLSKRRTSIRRIAHAIRATQPNLIYVNSAFSRLSLRYLLYRRLAGDRTPLLVAPRGEFDRGALTIHRCRKRLFLLLAKALGLFERAQWHATASSEAVAIERIRGSANRVHIVPNPVSEPPMVPAPHPPKEPGSVRFIFLSRLSQKKNVDFLLRVASALSGQVEISLVGPRDEAYWNRLQVLIDELPSNINVSWDQVRPAAVPRRLAQNHFFLLPTLGENFGHAIYEALSAGTPVVVSDRTPWSALQDSRAGWVISLSDPDEWLRILQRCVDMASDEYSEYEERAHRHARAWYGRTTTRASYDAMFRSVIGPK